MLAKVEATTLDSKLMQRQMCSFEKENINYFSHHNQSIDGLKKFRRAHRHSTPIERSSKWSKQKYKKIP